MSSATCRKKWETLHKQKQLHHCILCTSDFERKLPLADRLMLWAILNSSGIPTTSQMVRTWSTLQRRNIQSTSASDLFVIRWFSRWCAWKMDIRYQSRTCRRSSAHWRTTCRGAVRMYQLLTFKEMRHMSCLYCFLYDAGLEKCTSQRWSDTFCRFVSTDVRHLLGFFKHLFWLTTYVTQAFAWFELRRGPTRRWILVSITCRRGLLTSIRTSFPNLILKCIPFGSWPSRCLPWILLLTLTRDRFLQEGLMKMSIVDSSTVRMRLKSTSMVGDVKLVGFVCKQYEHWRYHSQNSDTIWLALKN